MKLFLATFILLTNLGFAATLPSVKNISCKESLISAEMTNIGEEQSSGFYKNINYGEYQFVTPIYGEVFKIRVSTKNGIVTATTPIWTKDFKRFAILDIRLDEKDYLAQKNKMDAFVALVLPDGTELAKTMPCSLEYREASEL